MFEPGAISHGFDAEDSPQSYQAYKYERIKWAEEKLKYILDKIEKSELSKYDSDQLKLHLIGMIK